jgi:hypothetical protein
MSGEIRKSNLAWHIALNALLIALAVMVGCTAPMFHWAWG